MKGGRKGIEGEKRGKNGFALKVTGDGCLADKKRMARLKNDTKEGKETKKRRTRWESYELKD